MGKRRVLLAEQAPKFEAHSGLFYVDLGLPDFPLVAYSPNLLLKAIARAKTEYGKWAAMQGASVSRGEKE